ncbi:Uncharacterised protein [Staphylococcus petrasii]|uniref:Uncharacterized protein n=1 Tax=Staphylococcus petrasii TaxID=1276936 RepID=A0A380FXK9_9STAP|nr:hypothetical protein [Staphylococcus petrasii]PNZ31807.1 hypothetical protein CD137_02420 [Staphylococcus petrasii]TGE11822.1 hypothetical protein E2557_07835 [Staphylococcus petrasii]TGE16364.1 hypothetical protein BJR09_09585 [Staphylococcus petrasii]SUM42718.1 Uncharacterised protein [Staphylococcus petrasii]
MESNNKPKIAQKRWFNIMLILVGILSFCIFYFVMGTNFLMASLFMWAPVVVGLVNLNENKDIDKNN